MVNTQAYIKILIIGVFQLKLPKYFDLLIKTKSQ